MFREVLGFSQYFWKVVSFLGCLGYFRDLFGSFRILFARFWDLLWIILDPAAVFGISLGFFLGFCCHGI